MGMIILVAFAAAYSRPIRRNGAEEGFGRACGRAVMRNFEHISVNIITAGNKRVFRLLFYIAREQKLGIDVIKKYNYAFVVSVVFGCFVRRNNSARGISKAERYARAGFINRDAFLVYCIDKLAVCFCFGWRIGNIDAVYAVAVYHGF